MKKHSINTYRVQHKVEKVGMFNVSDNIYTQWACNSDGMDKAIAIYDNFEKINHIQAEFPKKEDGELDLEEMRNYKCAFLSASHLISILPKPLFQHLNKYGFEVVRVKGKGIKADTQIFYTDEECKVQTTSFEAVLKHSAMEQAKQDIKLEFGRVLTVAEVFEYEY